MQPKTVQVHQSRSRWVNQRITSLFTQTAMVMPNAHRLTRNLGYNSRLLAGDLLELHLPTTVTTTTIATTATMPATTVATIATALMEEATIAIIATEVDIAHTALPTAAIAPTEVDMTHTAITPTEVDTITAPPTTTTATTTTTCTDLMAATTCTAVDTSHMALLMEVAIAHMVEALTEAMTCTVAMEAPAPMVEAMVVMVATTHMVLMVAMMDTTHMVVTRTRVHHHPLTCHPMERPTLLKVTDTMLRSTKESTMAVINSPPK